jgi:hypothetical protein
MKEAKNTERLCNSFNVSHENRMFGLEVSNAIKTGVCDKVTATIHFPRERNYIRHT